MSTIIGLGKSGEVILREDGLIKKNTSATEIKIQSSLSHPNIVKMRPDGLLECCEYTMHQRMSEFIDESQILFWIYELACALSYLHERHILHRDIKLDNVYILSGHVKLGDFGYATYDSEIDEITVCGTPNFMAPEIAISILDESVTPHYSPKSDIFALGCCLHALYAHLPPFQGKTQEETLNNIIRYVAAYSVTQSFECSPIILSLLRSMLDVDPEKRPDAKQVADTCLASYFKIIRKDTYLLS